MLSIYRHYILSLLPEQHSKATIYKVSHYIKSKSLEIVSEYTRYVILMFIY